jgi:membrane-associated phospholipid phosphatase
MNSPQQRRNLSCNALSIAVEATSAAIVLILFAITIIRPRSIPNAPSVSRELILALAAIFVSSSLSHSIPHSGARSGMRVMSLLALVGFLDSEMAGFQHVLVQKWCDESVLSFEVNLAGQPWGLLLQQVVHPYVTEMSMFAYVIYAMLLPATAAICYWFGGEKAVDDYLLALCVAFSICFVGFMIYPLAGPYFFSSETYSVPLRGGFFTQCGEWIRIHKHYPGGSLPSPHCAGATVMLAMLFRYNRSIAFVVLPTILLLYISTVYGRFHYAIDAVVGIATGVVAITCSPKMVELIASVMNRPIRIFPNAQPLVNPRLDPPMFSLSKHNQLTGGSQR